MPWPAHYHIEWGGRRGANTDEVWQNGIRLAYKEEDGPTEYIGQPFFEGNLTLLETLMGSWAWTVRNWFTRRESWIATDCLLEWCSASWVMPNGAPDRALSLRLEYDAEPMRSYQLDHFGAPPIFGGGTLETVHPYQCAMFVQWSSDVRSSGPGSRGGIYSPAPCMDLGLGSGEVRLEVRSEVLEAAEDLVRHLGVGAIPTNNHRWPSIVTPRAGGLRSRIDTVTVDGRLDVLRKRAAFSARPTSERRVDHPLPG